MEKERIARLQAEAAAADDAAATELPNKLVEPSMNGTT